MGSGEWCGGSYQPAQAQWVLPQLGDRQDDHCQFQAGQRGVNRKRGGGRDRGYQALAHAVGAAHVEAPIDACPIATSIARQPQLGQAAASASRQNICRSFSSGFCKYGERCKYEHATAPHQSFRAAPPTPLDQSFGGTQATAPNSIWGSTGAEAAGAPEAAYGQMSTGEGAIGGGRGAGGARKGKGKGRGKTSWGEGLPRHVRISKTLCQILRHKAPDLGIEIASTGFCKTEDLLRSDWLRDIACTLEDILKVAKESDKQRFEVDEVDGVHYIRATQGHSIQAVHDEESLRRLSQDDEDLPERCIHGTYRRHLESILDNGLKPGGTEGSSFRKHVHFSPFEPGDKRVISGLRYDAEVAIWMDLRAAIEAGVPFYISPNKVILSPGLKEEISPQFILKVTEVKTGKEIVPQRC